ncbi:MAG: IS200/IS605 family transposase [Muribaculaceae bacterium]|nr:IS200/IS605 family transposase [Muribaculaceae bacterium]
MSKYRALYHIVFATKHRQRTIPPEHKRELYAYIYGIIKNKNCQLLRMNGVEDHVHILMNLHPSIALANLIRDIKLQSGNWMKSNPDFADFQGWADGYYAFTLDESNVEKCKLYIINQELHHKKSNLIDEMERLSSAHNVSWDIRDWA